MSNNNSMLWLFLLLALTSNGDQKAVISPANEEICEKFESTIGSYLYANKELVEKADSDSPIGMLYRIANTAKKIEDPNIKVEVLGIAMSILSNIEKMNRYCCGGAI